MPSRTQQLQINHIGYQGKRDNEQNKPQFVVMRSSDLKSSAPVTLTGPDQTVVPGRPSSNLQQDLRCIWSNFYRFLSHLSLFKAVRL
ncbi:MAG: hypothetical protein D3914_00865 [Candidatus Electrothrix sp. LOE2]|nr:hypothetical protein [Candidatus Electrothrix sp. LOE2]